MKFTKTTHDYGKNTRKSNCEVLPQKQFGES